MTAPESIAGLAAKLEGVRLDVLINNAGILERNGLDDLDFESIRRQFEINSLDRCALRVPSRTISNPAPR